MLIKFFEDQVYEGDDFSESFVNGEYEGCTFNGCNFLEANLSDTLFADCKFIACNLSLCKLYKTSFQDVKFQDCKMMGMGFDVCNTIGLRMSFKGCLLDHSVFYKLKLKATVFEKCQLNEVDLSECDLSSSKFIECDFTGTQFDHTNLEKSNFCSSQNYHIDPEQNRIKKANFDYPGVLGLLFKYDIGVK